MAGLRRAQSSRGERLVGLPYPYPKTLTLYALPPITGCRAATEQVPFGGIGIERIMVFLAWALENYRHTAFSYLVVSQHASLRRILELALSRLLTPLHTPIQSVHYSLRTRVMPHASFGLPLSLLVLSCRPLR